MVGRSVEMSRLEIKDKLFLFNILWNFVFIFLSILNVKQSDAIFFLIKAIKGANGRKYTIRRGRRL